VSKITYNVLMATFNPAHLLIVRNVSWSSCLCLQVYIYLVLVNILRMCTVWLWQHSILYCTYVTLCRECPPTWPRRKT